MQAEVKGTTMPMLEVLLDRGEQVISPTASWRG
jgi:hypothetical protein